MHKNEYVLVTTQSHSLMERNLVMVEKHESHGLINLEDFVHDNILHTYIDLHFKNDFLCFQYTVILIL